MRSPGHIALLLHAHLPFVRHPEQRRCLEEHWLFEAITDVYLPLIRVLSEAEERGSGFRLTLSLSPTLLSMLGDRLLRQRYLEYLERRLRLAERLASDRSANRSRRALGRFYAQRLTMQQAYYADELDGDLISGVARLARRGALELITTAATHGYLPLLRSEPMAVRAQLQVARDYFREVFGHVPEGLWLPECGYYPGLDKEVSRAGFRYFVLDAHGLQRATPVPRHGVYAPASGVGGVVVFGREPESARAIWCAQTGYPANPVYREFHWDLGYESDDGLLQDFLPPGVTSGPTGVKLYRVTGGEGPKAAYDPTVAAAQAERDARRFVAGCRRLLAAKRMPSRPPIMVAPYDAELFGHWWFEGPVFLAAVIRTLDEAADIRPVTLSEHLRLHGCAEEICPATSSWGEHGYNGAWLRRDSGWVCLSLHQASAELRALVAVRGQTVREERSDRLLRQAARSLLLAQSSDWTFQMGRAEASPYWERRLREHLARFRFLSGGLHGAAIREEELIALEWMDNLFPNLRLEHFG